VQQVVIEILITLDIFAYWRWKNMARIFPSTLNNYDFKEPGEERLFTILKNLPDDCRVWYEVVLGVRSRKPDFLVLDPKRGIIILEVKDWGKSTIQAASPTEFRIKAAYGRHVDQKNPIRKCKVYVDEASEKLELESSLIGKHDKLLFPIEYFLVFPNLSEDEFIEIGLEKYLEKDHIIFQKEVRNQTTFIKRLYSNLPELAEPLSAEMQLAVRRRLREENTLDAPGGKDGLLPGILPEGMIEYADKLAPDVFAVDVEQEELAKDLGGGPRLMRGIAGTGKTLIMLMRAKLLASNAESKQQKSRILVLCWNVSLANYMRQAFDSINIPLQTKAHADISSRDGIPIMHFMEFARQLVKSHPESYYFPRSSDDDFENLVSQRLAELKIKENEKYDVIIVDEAQDLKDEWLKFLFEALLKGDEPKQKNLILAADDAQRVYKSRSFSWESLGIPMKGDRSSILRKIYRNSARVWGFAGFLLGDIKKYYDESSQLQFTPKRGVDPQLVECNSLEEQIEYCVKDIKNIGKNGYSWRNVLVLYNGKSYKGYPLIDRLMQQLKKENIPCDWITENMEAKSTFLMGRDSVKISTALSAKGLDSPKVIILNAESFGGSDNDVDETKLMYVALTRAREELTILHTGQKGIVPELQKCKSLYEKYRPRLIEFEKSANEAVI
jgi:hypothetical protein